MEKKKKTIYWTDLHSNIHHEGMNELPKWIEHAKSVLDFWPIAYYPYFMRKLKSGMGVEDIHDLEEVQADWETLREAVKKVNEEDHWPMFMGYEWQGAGLDGDHNVFFKDNDQKIAFPYRYEELAKEYKNCDAIAIPHHLAYQSENRGKNWDTHIEAFSPFVEVYSSHGSSENDYGSIPMMRHVHMGPRVGKNSVESGLNRGYRFGMIASGDNHSVPAVAEFGTMAVLSEGLSKDQLWEAMTQRHVYGVSNERIQMNFEIDEAIMGDETEFHDNNQLHLDVTASNALDRIEIIQDNEVTQMISCHQTRKQDLPQTVRFKFKLEFGWGPDRRIFPDIESRLWHGLVETNGKILSVEKCWNSFGQKVIKEDENSFEFEVTSYKTTQTGKWMGLASITTEGFIFEVETDVEDVLLITVDKKVYEVPVRQILKDSTLFSLDDEIQQLLEETYHETQFYRNDTWWHNAYKFKISKGALASEYQYELNQTINLKETDQIRVKVYQKNGSLAWSSPIFNKRKAS